MRIGLLLLADGPESPSIGPNPFQLLRQQLVAQLTRSARGQPIPVEIAYLEMMAPGLENAVHHLQAQGVQGIHLVPVFFGQSSHVRFDLPEMVQEIARRNDIRIHIAPAVGDSEAVAEAITSFCLEQRHY